MTRKTGRDRVAVADSSTLGIGAVSSAVWRRVIENLEDAVFVLDAADDVIVEANHQAVALYGWPREQLIGLSLRMLSAGEQPIAKTGRFRTHHVRRDGSQLVADVVASLIDYDGREAILAINRNVTEESEYQQRAEEAALAWRSTFDAIDAAVLVLDSSTHVVRLNETARQLAETPSFGDVLGQPVGEIGRGEPWQSFSRMAKQTRITPQSSREQSTDPDSQRIWDIHLTPASLPEGQPGVIVVARDVTNFVMLEGSARRNELVAEMGRLVGNVAHEVRNPLFSISANLDMLELRTPNDDPVAVRCTQNLRVEVRRMLALMQDLLEYGKPPSPDVHIERTTTPALDAIRAATASASARGVSIENRVHDHGEILVDRSRIAQALQNVIENAIQYTPAAMQVVVSSCVAEIGSARWLFWRVDDRGPGFSQEAIQSAFEPFYTTRSGGTGLGLSIVRRIVDMHGGRASVENLPEGGGRVTIAIPLRGGAS